MRVKGKVTIITGGASGIGRATALLFGREGAKLIIADFDSNMGSDFDGTLKGMGFESIFVKTDVRKSAEVQRMVELAVDHFGKIDVLVNNAGVGPVAPVVDLTEEDWDRVLDTNLKGVYLCCKYAIPELIKGGGGSIINLASILGIVGRKRSSVYNASKGGVILLTKNMAIDYVNYNIRVNAVCPGYIETPPVMGKMKSSGDFEKAYEEVVNLHPMRRLGKAEEIAYGILFLASDESSFMTGSSLIIDGGYTAQ